MSKYCVRTIVGEIPIAGGIVTNNEHLKIVLVYGIIALFICMSITPSVAIDNAKKSSITLSYGNTLYVGGTGPGNYTKIQDAIDDASDGDTVFVYNGTYYENIIIDESISLVGEDKNTTIIDGDGTGNVVTVNANKVYISGFTIRNSGVEWDNAGIKIYSNHNNITDNNISSNNNYGIWLKEFSHHNNIIDNTISLNNKDGIYLQYSRNNTITGNFVFNNNFHGIILDDSSFNNNIKGNTISSNFKLGIYINWGSSYNIVNGNNIISNYYGAVVVGSSNIIIKNNFFNNEHDASFVVDILGLLFYRNRWRRNYWNESRVLPKFIIGRLSWYYDSIPWINFDLFPAKKPYDIDV